MGVVVSATVFTTRDLGGTPRTQGYFTLEFRNAGYVPGGENFDLSAYFRRIDAALSVLPVSGAILAQPRVGNDYPTDARSGRFMLEGLASGIGISVASGASIFISGLVGISVASGTILINSGLASGFQSGLAAQASLFSGILDGGGLGTLFSGTIQINTASGQFTPFRTEILSGVAVSGTRAQAWIVGY